MTGDVMREVCRVLLAPGVTPLVEGCRDEDTEPKRCEAGQERSLESLENDCQAPQEVVGDTPGRTSSEDDEQQSGDVEVAEHIDVSPSFRTSMEVTTTRESECMQRMDEGRREKTHVVGEVHSAKKQQLPLQNAIVMLGEVETRKKVEVDRRRKRKRRSESIDISQASAKMLFRCSCQLLRNQALDYDVRAREMSERNTMQMKEIDEWEKRICSLKRELEEYVDERSDESTDVALIEAPPRTTVKAVDDTVLSTATAFDTVEMSLPPAVLAVEGKLQDELRKRTQKVKEFYQSVPGFIQSRDDPSSRHF